MKNTLAEKILLRFSREPEKSADGKNLEKWDVNNALNNLREVFPDFIDQIQNKSVLDFGCGLGFQTVALSMHGSKFVLGLESNEESISKAKQLAGKSQLQDKVDFNGSIDEDYKNYFDIVISQNSMEHFPEPQKTLEEMKSALNPKGLLYITFGPPWFSPTGSHMNYFTKIPWVNLLFSEKTVMNVRKNFRNDGAQKYEEVESGLNKMSVGKFERIVKNCGLKVKYKKYDCIKKMNILGKIPLLRELFINRINIILVQNKGV